LDGLVNLGPVLSIGTAAASGMAFLFSNSSNNKQFALVEANAKLRDLEAKEERLAMTANMDANMDAIMKRLDSIQTSGNRKQGSATEEPKRGTVAAPASANHKCDQQDRNCDRRNRKCKEGDF
jgi:hypothetical protein